MMQILAF